MKTKPSILYPPTRLRVKPPCRNSRGRQDKTQRRAARVFHNIFMLLTPSLIISPLIFGLANHAQDSEK